MRRYHEVAIKTDALLKYGKKPDEIPKIDFVRFFGEKRAVAQSSF